MSTTHGQHLHTACGGRAQRTRLSLGAPWEAGKQGGRCQRGSDGHLPEDLERKDHFPKVVRQERQGSPIELSPAVPLEPFSGKRLAHFRGSISYMGVAARFAAGEFKIWLSVLEGCRSKMPIWSQLSTHDSLSASWALICWIVRASPFGVFRTPASKAVEHIGGVQRNWLSVVCDVPSDRLGHVCKVLMQLCSVPPANLVVFSRPSAVRILVIIRFVLHREPS